MVADLGNARLLIFRGDGHDVLTSFNPWMVGALLTYLEEQTPPAPAPSAGASRRSVPSPISSGPKGTIR